MNVKAIVTDSHTGRTARVLAAFRGKSTVYAIPETEYLKAYFMRVLPAG